MEAPPHHGATLAVLLLALVVVCSPLALIVPADTASAAGSGTAIGDPTTASPLTHQLIFFQGEDPETSAVEPTSLVQVLDRTVWRVPWNETILYTSIPAAATGIVFDHVEPFSHAGVTVFGPGAFSADTNPSNPPARGRVASGQLSGLYYWQFPPWVSRALVAVRNPFTEGTLSDYDAAATTTGAWAIGSHSLALKEGVVAANYTGKTVQLGHDIESVNVTWSGTGIGENLTVQVSVDDGATWVDAVNGMPRSMDGPGAALRWRVGMVQDIALNDTPVLTNMSVKVSYIPESNEIWMNLEYEMTLDDGALDIPISFPFDSSQSALIFLGYFDSHVELKVEGMDVTAATMENFPGKMVYRHMSGFYAQDLRFKIETVVDSPGGSGTTALIVLGVLLILIAVVLYLYMGSRAQQPGEDDVDGATVDDGPEAGGTDEGEEGTDDADGEPMSGLEDLSLEELTSMKDDILRAIKRADGELEQGILGKDEHAAIRATYKRRAVQVMKAIEAKNR